MDDEEDRPTRKRTLYFAIKSGRIYWRGFPKIVQRFVRLDALPVPWTSNQKEAKRYKKKSRAKKMLKRFAHDFGKLRVVRVYQTVDA